MSDKCLEFFLSGPFASFESSTFYNLFLVFLIGCATAIGDCYHFCKLYHLQVWMPFKWRAHLRPNYPGVIFRGVYFSRWEHSAQIFTPGPPPPLIHTQSWASSAGSSPPALSVSVAATSSRLPIKFSINAMYLCVTFLQDNFGMYFKLRISESNHTLSKFGKSEAKFWLNPGKYWSSHCITSNMVVGPE